MIDLHVHTGFCPHAEGNIGDYVRQAFLGGKIRVLGFSEHLPFPEGFKDPVGDCNMKSEDVEGYIESVRLHAGGHDILCGAELDYIPGYESNMRAWCSDSRFDYLIGSVHCIGDWLFDYKIDDFKRGLDDMYSGDIMRLAKRYYRLVRDMTRKLDIQIVGHLDLVKKFDVKGQLSGPDYEELVEGALSAIADVGPALELNTAGLRKPVGRMYPETWIIRRCAELGIPITAGSDAHMPGEVGFGLENAVKTIRECGIKRLNFFRGKKMDSIIV